MKVQKSLYSSENLLENATKLLKKIIATPSLSTDEYDVSLVIEGFFHQKNIPTKRLKNNIWAVNQFFDETKPSIVLNTHHDTVKPNKAFTLDPFFPIEKDGKIFGLGSHGSGFSAFLRGRKFVPQLDHCLNGGRRNFRKRWNRFAFSPPSECGISNCGRTYQNEFSHRRERIIGD